MIIGEQPGDMEDITGRPFIGPAGKLLDDALIEAELNRSEIYVTNAVKGFKWKSSQLNKGENADFMTLRTRVKSRNANRGYLPSCSRFNPEKSSCWELPRRRLC